MTRTLLLAQLEIPRGFGNGSIVSFYYSLPISLKLQYRESPSTMWSTRSMPITTPAAASRRVSS
jgi:hypothetical protein